jgi:hypothetical protein
MQHAHSSMCPAVTLCPSPPPPPPVPIPQVPYWSPSGVVRVTARRSAASIDLEVRLASDNSLHTALHVAVENSAFLSGVVVTPAGAVPTATGLCSEPILPSRCRPCSTDSSVVWVQHVRGGGEGCDHRWRRLRGAVLTPMYLCVCMCVMVGWGWEMVQPH